jgi:hypothetical protein
MTHADGWLTRAFAGEPVRGAAHVLLDALLAAQAGQDGLDADAMDLALTQLNDVGAIEVVETAEGDYEIDMTGLLAACVTLLDSMSRAAARGLDQPVEDLVAAIRDTVNLPPDPFK